jgi:hypothetical protein
MRQWTKAYIAITQSATNPETAHYEHTRKLWTSYERTIEQNFWALFVRWGGG